MAKKKIVKKKNTFVRILLLLLPIIIAISILIYIKVVQNNNIADSEFFSPADSRPLMISIVIFMLGYMFFLLMMFSEEIREFFTKKVHHK